MLPALRRTARLALALSRQTSSRAGPSVVVSLPSTLASTRPLSTSPAQWKKGGGGKKELPEGMGRVRAESDTFETDVDVKMPKEKALGRMIKATDWARAQVYDAVERARGRVSPAILDGVRIITKTEPTPVPLSSIASVTVKQNTLFIDVWDGDAIKAVETALHSANLPGISPQRVSNTSIKIPISRPTLEQRQELVRNLGQTIESAKAQVRSARNDGLKAVGGKGAQGSSDINNMAMTHGKTLDELLVTAKKEMA